MKRHDKQLEKMIEKRIEQRIGNRVTESVSSAVCGFMAIPLIALLVWGVMLLWNWLAPDIFRLGTINYWQALGLFALCRILIGGISCGKGRCNCGSGGCSCGCGCGSGCNCKRDKFHGKWDRLTPEQREAFMKDNDIMDCDCGCSDDDDAKSK